MRILFVVFLGLLGAFNGRAFVLDLNSSAQPFLWSIDNPSVSIPESSFNRNTGAIRYYIGSDTYSVTNHSAEVNAVRASFDQWQTVPGTEVKFEYEGLLGGIPQVDFEDGTNVVFWITQSTLVNNGAPSGGMVDMSGVLAFAFPKAVDGTTELRECDIVINGVDFEWFTDRVTPRSDGFLIEGTVVHEIGHLLGLSHSTLGSATMYWTGQRGNRTQQAGLSSDEISLMQGLYGDGSLSANLGTVDGRVTVNGFGLYGGAVILEDLDGNAVAGTLTDAMGDYSLTGIPAGSYQIRADPLDPSFGNVLINGSRISTDYSSANVNFSANAPTPVAVTGAQVTTKNMSVVSGSTGFHISHILPNGGGNPRTAATQVNPVEESILIGVALPFGMTSQTTLEVGGTGVSVGATGLNTSTFSGFSFLTAVLDIQPDAAPGMRSLIVKEGTDTVYANGFLEIRGEFEDYNFDGLDDDFQRSHFSLWTADEAAPNNDPDRDQFPNNHEAMAGTDPNNTASFLQLEEVVVTLVNTIVRWQSVAGRTYQLFSRDMIEGSPWQSVGGMVTAVGGQAEAVDPTAGGTARFYRVQVVSP